jgi:hypothetical protein
LTALPPQLADLVRKRFTVVGVRRTGKIVRAWLEEPCGTQTVSLTVEQYGPAAALARELHEADKIEHVAVSGSGHVESYGYRESDRTLEVKFRARGGVGAVYRYFDVSPETVEDLRAAESKVLLVNSVIAKAHEYTRYDRRDPVRIIHETHDNPRLEVAS